MPRAPDNFKHWSQQWNFLQAELHKSEPHVFPLCLSGPLKHWGAEMEVFQFYKWGDLGL